METVASRSKVYGVKRSGGCIVVKEERRHGRMSFVMDGRWPLEGEGERVVDDFFQEEEECF